MRAGALMYRVGKAVYNAPRDVQDKAYGIVHRGKTIVEHHVDKVLNKVLPEVAADEVKSIVAETILSAVQQELLEGVMAGLEDSDGSREVIRKPASGSKLNWSQTAIANIGIFAVTKAAFSLCKKYKTELCNKVAKFIP